MAKSKKNNSVILHGYFDQKAGTVTEIIEKKNKDPEIHVYPFDSIVKQFDGKDVVISIRETTELPSD